MKEINLGNYIVHSIVRNGKSVEILQSVKDRLTQLEVPKVWILDMEEQSDGESVWTGDMINLNTDKRMTWNGDDYEDLESPQWLCDRLNIAELFVPEKGVK